MGAPGSDLDSAGPVHQTGAMARPLRNRRLLPREAAGESAAIPRLDLSTPCSSRFYVTSRGNARQDIFLVDPDRDVFLDTLADTVERFGRICRAYCLMSNHCHLLVETPEPNLSRGRGTAYDAGAASACLSLSRRTGSNWTCSALDGADGTCGATLAFPWRRIAGPPRGAP
jgi:hypothetical protein